MPPKNIDLEKRRRVMLLSQKLGHCICDPRRPCPCDVFRDDGICPCAGERPEASGAAPVRLTDHVRAAGCASKIPAGELDALLRRLPEVKDDAVLSGLASGDDAGIYRIAPQVHLVQTVDVFTPCVDDARQFGRICAANCLSDIYAMGGEPRTALSVLAFPTEKLPGGLMFEMLDGAMEVFALAGVALIGGHSIKDDEIKLGFAVTGLIDPAVAAALEHPQPGDALVLTKPLGSGVLAFARQVGRPHEAGLAAAEAAMATLNRAASEAMREAGATACTDVTGFGFFGHLWRQVRAAGVTARVNAAALPAFPGALEALAAGVVPGAIERNREYVGAALACADSLSPDDARVLLGFDAQTSGGLLIAVPQDRLSTLHAALARRGVPCSVVGAIAGRSDGRIEVVAEAVATALASGGDASRNASPATEAAADHAGCCADAFSRAPGSGTPSLAGRGGERSANVSPETTTASGQVGAAETQRQFGAFMRSVQAGGVLDERTKELLLFTLVVASRCGGCFDAHWRRARELGISEAALDEAAWCAVAMGGAPVRLFYQESRARVVAG